MSLFQQSDLFRIPFLLIWTAIPLTGLVTLGASGAPAFPFVLMPALFVCIGLHELILRRALDFWLTKTSLFIVTDDRAYLISKLPFAKCVVEPFGKQRKVSVARKKNGLVDITFSDLSDIHMVRRVQNPLYWSTFGSLTFSTYRIRNLFWSF